MGDHAEDVNGGKVEELDGVDEEDTDAGCGFRSHSLGMTMVVGRFGMKLLFTIART